MQKLLIDGKKTLSGSIIISGSKNSTLPILAATILNNHTTIKNIPFVNDIFTMLNLRCRMLDSGTRRACAPEVNRAGLVAGTA